MPRAQRGGDIPADSHENDVWGEMRTFEADRHRLSPSCVILGSRGRSYPKSTQMKICNRTELSSPRVRGPRPIMSRLPHISHVDIPRAVLELADLSNIHPAPI